MMKGFWVRFWILVVLIVITILTAQIGLWNYLESR